MLTKVTASGRSLKGASQRLYRALIEFRIRGVKTNIPFLENMITHPKFLTGDITVNFIQNHDELFQFKKRKNRATKILKFLANVTVNGNSDVRFIDKNKTFEKPIVPDYDRFAKPKDGTKQLLEKLGPEKFSQWLKEQKNVQITDTTCVTLINLCWLLAFAHST